MLLYGWDLSVRYVIGMRLRQYLNGGRHPLVLNTNNWCIGRQSTCHALISPFILFVLCMLCLATLANVQRKRHGWFANDHRMIIHVQLTKYRSVRRPELTELCCVLICWISCVVYERSDILCEHQQIAMMIVVLLNSTVCVFDMIHGFSRLSSITADVSMDSCLVGRGHVPVHRSWHGKKWPCVCEHVHSMCSRRGSMSDVMV